MKEVTRIHIAKVSYDIELDAKKEIQKYINALERYANDPELLDDIEIRVTELLAERGVTAGGVITKEDVAAVRTQLGEPTEFMSEDAGDIALGEDDIEPEQTRKLYRDQDGAILGGVLAGLARFFGIDPVWVRLIFIVLLFASFGTASIVYAILWFIVPPARTAAEKLRMNNQPVTLASIKKLNEYEETVTSAAPKIRRVLLYIFGAFALVGAIGAALITLVMGVGLPFGTSENSPYAQYIPGDAWWVTVAFVLFLVAGVLLAALCALIAYSAFAHKFTRKIGISIVAIIAAGLVVAGAGTTVVMYGQWEEREKAYNAQTVSHKNLPREFSRVTSLVIESDNTPYNVSVQYVVDETRPRIEFTGHDQVEPRMTLSEDGLSAHVSLRAKSDKRTNFYLDPQLTIYGPALKQVDAQAGYVHYYNKDKQSELRVNVGEAHFDTNGAYRTLSVHTTASMSDVTLDGATIERLVAATDAGRVSAGVVRELVITQADVCPAYDESSQNRVIVQAVTGNKVTYNNVVRSANSISTPCGDVLIGEEESDYEDE